MYVSHNNSEMTFSLTQSWFKYHFV